jgi:ATP-binding cassette subfamily B protein
VATSSGTIDWLTIRPRSSSRRAARTPQVPRLFSESLRENLPLDRRDDDAALARESTPRSWSRRGVVRARLDTLVGPRGVKLRVARFSAPRRAMFVRDAELLVVDDCHRRSTPRPRTDLWSRLFGRGREVTWLIVSHRPGAAAGRPGARWRLVD